MGFIDRKLNTSLDIIKTYLHATMHAPCNELSVNKPNRIETYEHQYNEPWKLSSYLEGYTDANQEHCQITNDYHLSLCFKGHGEGSGHKYSHTEKASCNYCEQDACRHCCHVEK